MVSIGNNTDVLNEQETRTPTERVASAMDSIGNAVLVSGMDIREAGYVFQPGRYPFRLMPSLIHEAAHFDTFNTPVGTALAALYLRCWTRSMRSQADDSSDLTQDDYSSTYEGLVDYLRYNIASATLLPLAEGLALFAEFDLLPANSAVTTSASLIAGTLCCGELTDEDKNKTIGEIAAATLASGRTIPFYQARKENLLTQPLSTGDGGYFPGYVLVKMLRNRLLAVSSKVIDGDLFFFCVNAVVFGDLKLARLLLDPELDLMFSATPEARRKDAINAVVERIQSRIAALFTKVDEPFIERVESVVGSGNPWSWAELQLESAESVDDDLRVLGKEMGRLTDMDVQPTDLGKALARTCTDILSNRNFLCLASFETKVKVNSAGRCMIGEIAFSGGVMPAASVPSLPNVTPGEGRGYYEIYWDRMKKESTLSFSVFRDTELVARGSLDEIGVVGDGPDIPMREMLNLRKDMETAFGVSYEGEDAYKGVCEHYYSQSGELIEHIYMNIIEGMVEDVLKGKVPESLKKSGLIGMAVTELDFVTDFAALSLVHGGLFLGDGFQKSCGMLRIDHVKFSEMLHRCEARTEFPLHFDSGELTVLNL